MNEFTDSVLRERAKVEPKKGKKCLSLLRLDDEHLKRRTHLGA